MPKGKLKLKNSDLPKLDLACELSEIKIDKENAREIGDTTIVPILFKTPMQLFEAGRYIDKIKLDSK